MALSPHINIMLRAMEKAGRTLIRDFGEVEQLQVSRKGPGDFVSAADRRAEDILFAELSKARPDYGFLMEESGESKGPKDYEYRWIIDPLDGTTNFLHGILHWCISVGLEHQGEIVAGVVFDPAKDETFRAEKGGGAFMRNKRLRVSGRRTLENALISLDHPPLRTKEAQNSNIAAHMALLQKEMTSRRLGAIALDLCYIAAGRLDAYHGRGGKPWDIAAGNLILKEAGGTIRDIDDDKANPIYTGNVLATNGELFQDLRKLLQAATQ